MAALVVMAQSSLGDVPKSAHASQQMLADAQRTIRDIESMVQYEPEEIDLDGTVGAPFAALKHILALGLAAHPE